MHSPKAPSWLDKTNCGQTSAKKVQNLPRYYFLVTGLHLIRVSFCWASNPVAWIRLRKYRRELVNHLGELTEIMNAGEVYLSRTTIPSRRGTKTGVSLGLGTKQIHRM